MSAFQVFEFLIVCITCFMLLAGVQGQTLDKTIQEQIDKIQAQSREDAKSVAPAPEAKPADTADNDADDDDSKLTCEQARNKLEQDYAEAEKTIELMDIALASDEDQIFELRAKLDRALTAKTAEEAYRSLRQSEDQ